MHDDGPALAHRHGGDPAVACVMPNVMHTDTRIAQTILQLLGERAHAASICPSEVARALEDDEAAWRALMPRVRDVAADLQDADRLRITRGSAVLARDELEGGPIRLRRPAA